MMTEKEIKEMQRLIDAGIQLAQKRLWERAGAMGQTLIVSRNGQIMEMLPEGESVVVNPQGDPLSRRMRR